MTLLVMTAFGPLSIYFKPKDYINRFWVRSFMTADHECDIIFSGTTNKDKINIRSSNLLI